MESFEEKLKAMVIEAQNNGQKLVRFQAEALESNEEDEDQRLLARDIQRHKETVNTFEETAKKALKAVTFEWTGQRIYNVKATDHSVTLTGLVNAENVSFEQDIDNISADKYSVATAGVVNNFDLKDLYSQMFARET
ncbi:hypothetical protein IL306_015031 [Fusarium sp. DS 682]|nr:hypothetical protein IL306_015031 [Fusarium sp. DS 682]